MPAHPKPSKRPTRRRSRPAARAAEAIPAAMLDAIVEAITTTGHGDQALAIARRQLSRHGLPPTAAPAAIAAARVRALERLEVNPRLEWAVRLLRNDAQYAAALADGDHREARMIAKDHGAILREWAVHGGGPGDDPGRDEEVDQALAALRSAGLGHEGDCLADLIREALALLIQHNALPTNQSAVPLGVECDHGDAEPIPNPQSPVPSS